MRPEEVRAMMAKALQSAQDPGQLSDLLNTVTEDFNTTFAEKEAREAEVQRLKADNESLRATNMKLFLKQGGPDPDKKADETPPKAVSFNDLFNEKGELK